MQPLQHLAHRLDHQLLRHVGSALTIADEAHCNRTDRTGACNRWAPRSPCCERRLDGSQLAMPSGSCGSRLCENEIRMNRAPRWSAISAFGPTTSHSSHFLRQREFDGSPVPT